MSKKTIKAWAVVWVDPNASGYGMRHGSLISSVEENTDACATFLTRIQASKWCGKNVDWKVIPCTITYTVPKKLTK